MSRCDVCGRMILGMFRYQKTWPFIRWNHMVHYVQTDRYMHIECEDPSAEQNRVIMR
jgi:hypothetical protein